MRAACPIAGAVIAALVVIAPTAAQTSGAESFLRGVAGTPPAACELILRSLDNRWGSPSVAPRVHEPLAADASAREAASWAWSGRPGPEDSPALLAGLESSDPCVRRVSARLVGHVDDRGTHARLIELARRGTGTTRLAAVAALSRSDDARASDVLEELVRSGEADVRRTAAWALARAGDEASVSVLAEALRGQDEALRENAAYALGRIESTRARSSLEAALRDGSVWVRINAAWALGAIEDAGSIPALATVVTGDADDRVRRAAAWALGRIEG